jgi:hypothetical protein
MREGLITHDFRRSAVRNLINAGNDQTKAMKITGHRTTAVFQQYNIVTTDDVHEASDKVVEFHAKKAERKNEFATQYQRKNRLSGRPSKT